MSNLFLVFIGVFKEYLGIILTVFENIDILGFWTVDNISRLDLVCDRQ